MLNLIPLFLLGITFSSSLFASEIQKSNPWDIRTAGATVVLEETVALEGGLLFPTGSVFTSLGAERLSSSDVSRQIYKIRLQSREPHKKEILIKCQGFLRRNGIECEVKYFARSMDEK
jgi:hypothetical protein